MLRSSTRDSFLEFEEEPILDVGLRVANKTRKANRVRLQGRKITLAKSAVHSTILLSGGIDSAACALRLRGRSVSATFIDYGQAAAAQERRAAKRVARFFGVPLTICEAHGPAKLRAGELRARNMFLIAAVLLLGNCKPGVLTIGIHAGTAYYDCSPAFYEIASRFVAEQTSGRSS